MAVCLEDASRQQPGVLNEYHKGNFYECCVVFASGLSVSSCYLLRWGAGATGKTRQGHRGENQFFAPTVLAYTTDGVVAFCVIWSRVFFSTSGLSRKRLPLKDTRSPAADSLSSRGVQRHAWEGGRMRREVSYFSRVEAFVHFSESTSSEETIYPPTTVLVV
ncbi:hypothetical protein CSUI_003036 [Cystoisospora suis]|uniref:Uncharacterized protein n=1 Tax=Cystoisospora suis TaxID=483139 RepID=A0A2C6L6Y8_9APIC|nr:hypothetical protein CSUI_003036 [Cystoisospora suis]